MPTLLYCLHPLVAATPQMVLKLGDNTLEGDTLRPGSLVAIEAGERETLTIQGLRGSAHKPIIVVNANGLVRVANSNRGYAIRLVDCQHVRFTGTGTPGLTYGFSAEATRKGMMAVHVVGRSSDIELDHIEVTGAGFAGFNIKDEPRKDGSTNRDQFVMRNINIHHNYVHDVLGEGFYIGHTFYNGHKKDGKTLFPHVIDGLKVQHNRTERTGCEGIQIGSSVGKLEVTDNIIIKPGIKPFAQWQDNGIQINAAGSIVIARNTIIDPPGNGLIGSPLEYEYNVRIERNLIVNPGGYTAYLGGKSGRNGNVEIVHNTFVRAGKGGYRIANSQLKRCIYVNNLHAGIPNTQWQLNGADQIEAGNLSFKNAEEAGITDAAAGNGELLRHSPARRKGVAIDTLKVGHDVLGRRATRGLVDVGAWASSGKSHHSKSR